jgi:hypothetical protein
MSLQMGPSYTVTGACLLPPLIVSSAHRRTPVAALARFVDLDAQDIKLHAGSNTGETTESR